MPLVNQIILREGDILAIIDQMRTSIPDEIKQARRVTQEKERILAQAQSEASNLLARSRAETQRAMEREGLLRAAEQRSQELLQEASGQSQRLMREAEEHAEHLKTDADGYVTDTLRALHEHLLNVETEVGHTIMSIERGLESLEVPPENPEFDDEVDEESEELPPPGHAMPRRISLAADTMGGPAY